MAIVKKLKHPLPYDELSALLKDAYKERTDAGLNFACASFCGEDLRNHLSENAIIFGAYESNRLVGMCVLNSINNRYRIRYGTYEYLAVNNSKKRQGIGRDFFYEMVKEAKVCELDFILSDTAVPAISAVKYHLKAGFKIYGHSHYSGRTYDSVNFILPLTFKGRLFASPIGRKILGLIFCKTY